LLSHCSQHSPGAALPARLVGSRDRRLSASLHVATWAVMESRMSMLLLAPARPATTPLPCQKYAQAPAVMLAQVARCRRAVNWILSPPGVHSHKLHRRL